MARIPTGLCWSRHLTDPHQPYKGCQGNGGETDAPVNRGKEKRRREAYMEVMGLKETLRLFICQSQFDS